ncbi:uncharacterized protein RCH25_019893 [Pelodytes ibericus]
MAPVHHTGCSLSAPLGQRGGTNVTFVMGCLDGDPVKLKLLKNYVSRSLRHADSSLTDYSFNIIYFSWEVMKWCDHAVRCHPETIAAASSWIQSLACGAGASLTDALEAAFEDWECQAVYLVIDALPGPVIQDVYSVFAKRQDTCTVHVVYLLGEPSDNQTEGSFRMIQLQPQGSSKQACGILHDSHCCKPHPNCSLLPTMHHEVRPLPFSCNATLTEHSSAHLTINADYGSFPPEALRLLRGARVLARRETDGFYYLGHIVREAEGYKDRFLVEFEKCRSLKGRGQFRMQETPVCDVIHYEDSRWRPLSTGDKVLAPPESNAEQYGPGTVLQGAESRQSCPALESSGVLVTFWNGKTRRIPPGLAVWISQQLYDRINLELHLPPDTRKKLVESYSCSYFPSPLGYSGLGCQTQEVVQASCGQGSQSCLYCGPDPGVCPRCHVPEDHWVALRESLSQISRMASKKEKTHRQMRRQTEEAQSERIQYREKKAKNKKSPSRGDQKLNQPSPYVSQTDSLIHNRDIQRTVSQSRPGKQHSQPAEGGSTSAPHNPGNMTHLQKTLHCIEKAMKEDSLALEAAIREIRPRTVPLKRNYELRAHGSQELRKQKEAAKVDLLNMQAEQRERRTTEKIQEMEKREQELQDTRRLRSERRLQLDIERRQDREGLETQQAQARRAAAEERYRKQKEAAEKELIRENQRVQFWTEHRKEREMHDREEIRKRSQQEEKQKELLQNRSKHHAKKWDSDLQDRHQHQELQESGRRKVSKKLEQFYQKVEQDSQKDKELHEYLKESNLQSLRSSMAL